MNWLTRLFGVREDVVPASQTLDLKEAVRRSESGPVTFDCRFHDAGPIGSDAMFIIMRRPDINVILAERIQVRCRRCGHIPTETENREAESKAKAASANDAGLAVLRAFLPANYESRETPPAIYHSACPKCHCRRCQIILNLDLTENPSVRSRSNSAETAARDSLSGPVTIECAYAQVGDLVLDAIKVLEQENPRCAHPLNAVTDNYRMKCASCEHAYDRQARTLLAMNGLPNTTGNKRIHGGPNVAAMLRGTCVRCGGSRCQITLDLSSIA